MASTSLETKTPFFDGPSDDGIFIIAGNSKHKEEVTKEKVEDTTDIAEIPQEQGCFSRIFSSNKKENPIPILSRQKVYEYYIGKFNQKSTNLYRQNIYDNKENNEFNVTSPRIIGTLSALALCKTRNWNPKDPTDNKNRFALADDKGISIYEIKEAVKQSKRHKKNKAVMSVQRIGFGELFKQNEDIINSTRRRIMNSDATIIKLSFITPKTLLGLTHSGKLFSFALDTQFNTITSAPHTIKNKEGQELVVHNFALNPCKPNQVVLCTKEGNILYLNLKHCMKPAQGKKAKLLMSVEKLPDSMWFYDTRLCLGSYFALETENYTLADLDLRLEKK